jgi:hypothetical protein
MQVDWLTLLWTGVGSTAFGGVIATITAFTVERWKRERDERTQVVRGLKTARLAMEQIVPLIDGMLALSEDGSVLATNRLLEMRHHAEVYEGQREWLIHVDDEALVARILVWYSTLATMTRDALMMESDDDESPRAVRVRTQYRPYVRKDFKQLSDDSAKLIQDMKYTAWRITRG